MRQNDQQVTSTLPENKENVLSPTGPRHEAAVLVEKLNRWTVFNYEDREAVLLREENKQVCTNQEQ